MKSIALATLLMIGIAASSFAQDKVVTHHDKVKKTSTVGQKVHNVFHKKKHYSGYKVKKVTEIKKAHS